MENELALVQSRRPGALLRELRTERRWTLSEVSERTGLTISTLSKIENDRMALTYDKMMKIATGLNVDIGVLFAAPGPTSGAPEEQPVNPPAIKGRRSMTRAGEERVIETRNLIQHYPAADLLNKQLVPIITNVKARTRKEFGELLGHPGEEYIYVLEGVLEFQSEFYAPLQLNVGDSLYFDSAMKHGYVAAGDGTCRILSIMSTTGWGAAAAVDATEDDGPLAHLQIVRAS